MNKKGITLIELLIAMAIASILVAGIYRTFLSQQHIHTVQEQVVDMQQNVRIGINRMVREIRMAGYGSVSGLCADGWKADDKTTVHHIVTPGTWTDPVTGGTSNTVTIVGGFDLATTVSALHDDPTRIYLASVAGFEPDSTSNGKQYICFNGLETRRIKTMANTITPGKGYEVELDSALTSAHKVGESVYRGGAITYRLGEIRTTRTTSGWKPVLIRRVGGIRDADPVDESQEKGEVVGENIEALEFTYGMADKSVRNGADLHNNQLSSDALSYVNIRAIQVNLVARTELQDPTMKTGDHTGDYRRRELTSMIQLRNLSFQ